MGEITLILLVAIAIENITDILTTVDLLEKKREWFRNKFPKIGKLATCNYCQTWWLSGIVALFIPLTLVSGIFECAILGYVVKWIVGWLVISRVANFFGVTYAVCNSIEDFLSQYINEKSQDS
jgi:hypothetical protein